MSIKPNRKIRRLAHFQPGRAARAYGLLAVVGLIGALGGSIGLRAGLATARDYRPAFALDDEALEQVNTSPFALMMGEIRTSAADLMWIKTERYMHNGVGFRPHLNAQSLAHTGEVRHGEAHEGEHMAALIPERQSDYRGFVGDLHRAIQPWQDASVKHAHAGGDELLPWYRLLTMSNPHHVRGYITGSWWLLAQAREGKTELTQALAFIEEGIRNNPKEFQLALMHGRVLLAMERPHEAIEAFRTSARLAEAIRPEGGAETPPAWTYWEEDDYRAAVHYVPAIAIQRLHDTALGLQTLSWAEARLPGDGRLAALRAYLNGPPA